MTLPAELRTDRLLLRPWRTADAEALHPILETNWDHLGPWIPARVATPASIPSLIDRLDGFAREFNGEREWRYAMLTRADSKLLGELSLFPRSATARAPFGESDRVELGYWLRLDENGHGFVTEAARAALAAASRIDRFHCVEIRCDARNEKSSAVPQRLGFTLSRTIVDPAEPEVQLQVWSLPLGDVK
jgi:ribosomal-protein-serine acetyltransferase